MVLHETTVWKWKDNALVVFDFKEEEDMQYLKKKSLNGA